MSIGPNSPSTGRPSNALSARGDVVEGDCHDGTDAELDSSGPLISQAQHRTAITHALLTWTHV